MEAHIGLFSIVGVHQPWVSSQRVRLLILNFFLEAAILIAAAVSHQKPEGQRKARDVGSFRSFVRVLSPGRVEFSGGGGSRGKVRGECEGGKSGAFCC